jgi:uncharacterized membrane protein YbhN (UPF0104 family)
VATTHATPAAEVAPSHHVWSHVFNILVLVGGVIALSVMMERLGWDNARAVLVGVGGWFWLILALDLVGMALDAGAIHAFMRPEALMVSYWQVFAAQASGRAINIFVPGGVVGEATKVSMLVTRAPRDRVLSSIVLFNLATFYISVAIVLVGVPITLLMVDLPHDLEIAVWIALVVLVPIVVVIAVIVHRGAINTALGTLRRVGVISKERCARWRASVGELDNHLKELHSDKSPGTRSAFGLLLISRLVAWIATIVVLGSIGVTLHLTVVIGVLSVGVLISWISAIIPFGFGIADGGNYALFDALGASGAHGVFVTLLNRARTISIALIGFAIMAIAHFANRGDVRRRHRHYRSLTKPPA